MVLRTGPSQAATVAAAVEKPTYFRKSLRLVEDPASFSLSPKNSSTGICSLNSFCFSASIMESSGFNSASLFQYLLFDAIAIYLRLSPLFFNSDILHIPDRPFGQRSGYRLHNY